MTNVVVFFEDAKATGMVSAPHESKSRPPKAYELARQLGVPPRAVVAAARALNLPVQNRLTRLIPAHVDAIIRYLRESASETGADLATDTGE